MVTTGGQKGQLIIEAILLMVLFMSIVFVTAAAFRKGDFISKLVSGPWQNLSGMLQNGVWSTPSKGAAVHPNHNIRHISLEGDSPQ